MREFTAKIVTNKVTITEADNPSVKSTFSDINLMVKYVRERGIKIVNPEVLPEAFQKQLTTNH